MPTDLSKALPFVRSRFFCCAGLLFVLFLALQLSLATRVNGDGAEYLMMTHAIGTHGTPILSVKDFREFLDLPRTSLDAIGYPKDFYEDLLRVFEKPQPASYAGYASIDSKDIYSIHFWMYSLLAVPFFWLMKLLGGNPLAAFTLLNVTFIGGTIYYLWKYWNRGWMLSSAAFLCAGTSFYLKFTGPEVMAACATLVATLAIIRSQTALAVFIGGLAATQNPSLIFVIPVAIACRIFPSLYEGLRTKSVKLGEGFWEEAVWIGFGIVVAVLPYLFFYLTLGVPSIPGKYFANPEFISASRFFSLVFDLDQGMILALPGLFVAILLGAFQRNHRGLARAYALAMVLFLICALPTLSAINWNSGGVVLARYAYWLGCPFVALVVFMVHERTRFLRLIVLLFFALQLVVLWNFKIFGNNSDPTAHTGPAIWALNNFGEYYHPDPEIFIERGTGSEFPAPLSHERTYLHLVNKEPAKLLVSKQTLGAATYCPQGELLTGSKHVSVGRGWEYHHPPFTCLSKSEVALLSDERQFGRAGADNSALIAGWSGLETTGVWTEGKTSKIELRREQGDPVKSIQFSGHYFDGLKGTDVEINGRAYGIVNLQNEVVDIPSSAKLGSNISIVLRHPGANSPFSRGESGDTRELGFFLSRLVLRSGPTID